MNNKVNNMVKMMAVLMGLLVSGSMSAQNGNVREETARQVGLNFLKLKDGNPRSDLQLTRVNAVQYPNLYVYNTSEDGFIVVASDNRMEPILAYSDEGTFDKDDVAPGANFWFEMYEYAIDSIVRNNVRVVDEKITQKWEDLINGVMPEPDRSGYYPSSYGPLIMTNWGQGWPYNTFCPYFKENSNRRAVTGCVATALGQLLYYFNRNIPKRSIAYAFRHEASTSYSCLMLEGVYATFSSDEKNGCNMPARNYYSIGGWNQYSGDEYVAKMLLDCGLAVDMTYGEESGAWDLQSMACNNESSAENALKTYFGFPRAFGYYKMEIPQYWTDTLKKYLCHNIPIMYGGNSNNGAHSFLCDGYDNAGLFHFNMGNYGSYNGNYYIYDIDGYNYKQTGLFVYPVADDDVHVENITVQYGESRLFPWCNDSIRISQGSSCAITDSSIIYNRPALYRLINRCQMNSTVLLLNALVVQSDTIKESAEICRHDNYTHNGFYNNHEFSISFSREETNFPGTIKTFYKPAYDDSSGEYLGICELTLTLSGEVSFIRDTLEKSICELADEYNTNYGIYDWHVDTVVIKCQGSGDYEYVKHNNNACDTVFTLHLTITEPENRKDDNVTTCTNEYTWDRNGKTYFNFGYYEEYYYCQNDSLYILHWIRSDTTTIMEERFICFDSLPFVYRDTIINESDPGLYSYDIVEHSNDSTGCDKHYLLVLTILEDCCTPDMECLEEAIEGNDRNVPSNKETIYYQLKHYFEYRDATNLFLTNTLKGIPWTNIEERNTFWNVFQSLLDNNSGLMSEQAIQQLIATNPIPYVPEIFITDLVERYNRSVMYWNEGYYSIWNLPQGYNTDFINYDTVSMNKAYEAYDYAITHGFNDVKAMYDNAYELLAAEVDNNQSAVCARVTVQFTQKMTMTREAFNGTLQIFNGHESIPMEDIFVDFRIEDQQGNDCTNLFQINMLSLDQITGISGDGSLAAQTNGTALVQFIPTKNAAPTEPKVYSFGGSFSFIDPFTGEGLTYPLYPVDITVNPSPDLYVDYFMQRDILGDDALTTDVVEPSVPAELGVIIHNQGAGEAKNVTLETAEPQIIDNEKGLAIDFAMYGASFNGSPRQLGLMEIPFGNIGSGQTAVGEWLFTSSLLGHFVSYEAHVIHNSSYGNPDLSLVSHLDIHELIHPIYAYGNLDDGINDFLVNDNSDAYDTPDSIYFSQGGRTAVGIVDNISFDHYVESQDTIVILTINPSRIGWNYGVTEDPGRGNYDLVSCTRDFDGQVIPLNNVWQTFVTIPDGGDPVYENKLHIVDTLSNDVQDFTYTLVYSLKNNLLDVLEITGIPESYIGYPLESFTVMFNEAIIDSTFTYEDMTLKCQNGPNLMDSSIVITKVNDSIYDVNISGLTNETGLYVLNVSTLNIKDSRGYNGYKGKQATWVQVIEDHTQTMNFAQGWNWWSTYIEQEGIDGLSMLENSLGESGVGIVSQAAGYTYYYPDYGWYGSLAVINNESSYKINANEPCTAVITGQEADPSQHPITLGYGWTWIGYVPSVAMDVNEALSGVDAIAGDMLKSQEGYSEFYADYGWYGSLSTIESGMGLMYYSSNGDPITFTYPNNGRGGEMKANLTSKHNHWKPNVYAYPDNMTVMAVVELGDTELSTDNYELAVFAANGECRGSVRLLFAEPLHRHVAFLTVSGKDAAELSFRLYDTETGMEYYDAEESLSFVANAIVGDASELYVVHFRGTTGVDELANKVQFYPNPVNRGERFSINVAEDVKGPVRVEIVNALGVETLRATSEQTPAALTAPATAGIYTLRITVEGKGTVVRKLVVK